jgi:serine/threonine protein kinase
MAPEVLEGIQDKPADIFSTGLIVVEMTANCQLPASGESWQKLRLGDLSDVPYPSHASLELLNVIHAMIHPDPMQRPTVAQLLLHPNIANMAFAQL